MLAIGEWVHGHASGAFGRDHYSCAQVELIGRDYAVFRTTEGRPIFATSANFETLEHNRDRGIDPDYCKSSWRQGCSYDVNYDYDN